jgi:hypothetical protein
MRRGVNSSHPAFPRAKRFALIVYGAMFKSLNITGCSSQWSFLWPSVCCSSRRTSCTNSASCLRRQRRNHRPRLPQRERRTTYKGSVIGDAKPVLPQPHRPSQNKLNIDRLTHLSIWPNMLDDRGNPLHPGTNPVSTWTACGNGHGHAMQGQPSMIGRGVHYDKQQSGLRYSANFAFDLLFEDGVCYNLA